jgi:hypothetical protein
MSRFFRRPTLLTLTSASAILLIAAASCKKKDDNDYLLGPDQDDDGWPYELDCDDRDETVFPSADDIPGDGIDQDCSGSDASSGFGGQGGEGPPISGDGDGDEASGGEPGDGDGDGDGDQGTGGAVEPGIDADGDGFFAPPVGEDCDDTRREVFPGAVELVFNGIDENCDGSDLVGVVESRSILPEGAVLGEVPDLAAGVVEDEPRLLMVWADSRVAPRQDVYAQLYDLEGEPVGDEIAVDNSDNNAKAGVRVVSKGDGFLVVWATSEGVFAQQLDAEGDKLGVLFGLGEPGAQNPVPAYGGQGTANGGAWAVAWTRPGDEPGTQGQLRGMSAEAAAIRAPIQTLAGPTDTISGVALTGHAQGFLVAWEGSIGEGRGIVAQDASRTATLRGQAFNLYEGEASGAALTANEGGFFLAFRAGGPLGYAAGLGFSSFDEPFGDPTRLSSESAFQNPFRVAPLGDDFFALWRDGRHLGEDPVIQSVYGNRWTVEGTAWSGGRAFYAESDVEFGGLAVVEGVAYSVILSDGQARLLSTHFE